MNELFVVLIICLIVLLIINYYLCIVKGPVSSNSWWMGINSIYYLYWYTVVSILVALGSFIYILFFAIDKYDEFEDKTPINRIENSLILAMASSNAWSPFVILSFNNNAYMVPAAISLFVTALATLFIFLSAVMDFKNEVGLIVSSALYLLHSTITDAVIWNYFYFKNNNLT